MREFITIVENWPHVPVGFVTDDGSWFEFACEYGSGSVTADFEARVCSIYEFQSNGKAPGNGRRTLQWLRQHFDRINVIDPGEDEDGSLGFWRKMRKEKLVNGIYDENDRPIR